MPSALSPGLSRDQSVSNSKGKRKLASTSSKSDDLQAAAVKKIRPSDHKNKSRITPATPVLVIDNGGSKLKYGWNTDKLPRFIPNVTARLQQQWTVLVGDQLETIQNPNQLIGVTRSTERGFIVNLGNQIQVWKRILDLMNINFPMQTSTAQAFGWKPRRSVDPANANGDDTPSGAQRIASHSCAVLFALPPFCPRTILDQILHIWMVDFDFAHVGFCVSSVCAAVPHSEYQTCCIVDLGWSACHVVPTFGGRPLHKAVRRLPVGARHLIKMWKHYASYRQYNLMDQEWILQDVLERTAFVSLRFDDNMKVAMKIPAGRRPYDREYVLPDYKNTFKGEIQLPPALQNEAARNRSEILDQTSLDDESIERPKSPEVSNEADVDEGSVDSCVDENEVSNDSEEEEDLEKRRSRIIKERAEEARRRLESSNSQQVLKLSVERFVIPETLFRPTDTGLPQDWAGLPAAIVQSISACPHYLHAALYRSIHLVGGLSQTKNLKQRLQLELRTLAPSQFELNLTLSESPEIEAWLGACKLTTEARDSSLLYWSREEHGSDKPSWKRRSVAEGGYII